MSTDDAHLLLVHVLGRFFPMDQPIVLTEDQMPEIARGLIEIFGMLGWHLEYDPTQLEKVIAEEIERLGPAPAGVPAREPELFIPPA